MKSVPPNGKPTLRPRDAQPNAAERAGVVAALVKQGFSGTALAAIVTTGLTRGQIADALIRSQRSAPKA